MSDVGADEEETFQPRVCWFLCGVDGLSKIRVASSNDGGRSSGRLLAIGEGTGEYRLPAGKGM